MFPIAGGEVITNNMEVDFQNPYKIYMHEGTDIDCDDGTYNPACTTSFVFQDMGIQGGNNTTGATGHTYTFAIPAFRNLHGTRGFYVSFYNRVSSIKADINNNGAMTPEDVHLLDPSPQGSGEWVKTVANKWDINFVTRQNPIQIEQVSGAFKLSYTLPLTYGTNEFPLDYVVDRWYMPSAAHPSFVLILFDGK